MGDEALTWRYSLTEGGYHVEASDGTVLGRVRLTDRPLRGEGHWGYEMVPTPAYRNGFTCDGGFTTRWRAAQDLVERYAAAKEGVR